MTILHTELAAHVSESKSPVRDAITNPDLLAVCGFAAIGLLLTIVIAHTFPIGDLANVFALLD